MRRTPFPAARTTRTVGPCRRPPLAPSSRAAARCSSSGRTCALALAGRLGGQARRGIGGRRCGLWGRCSRDDGDVELRDKPQKADECPSHQSGKKRGPCDLAVITVHRTTSLIPSRITMRGAIRALAALDPTSNAPASSANETKPAMVAPKPQSPRKSSLSISARFFFQVR